MKHSKEETLDANLSFQIQEESVVEGHVMSITSKDKKVSSSIDNASVAVSSSRLPSFDLPIKALVDCTPLYLWCGVSFSSLGK